MGGTLGWPALVVLGFVALTAVVVVLGASATARYEFECNRVRERRSVDAGGPRSSAALGASPRSVGGGGSGSGDVGSGRTGATEVGVQPAVGDCAVGLAERPAPSAADAGPAWWLADAADQAVAGPFADQVDAEWAALDGGVRTRAVHGARRPDGVVTPRPTPEDCTYYTDLGNQIERLSRDWDDVMSDTDPLTTLVVEVVAALVDAGLPLHAAREAGAGGVCVLPEASSGGVVVGWRAHERMSVRDVRGSAASDAVHLSMNAVVVEVLQHLGFVVEPVCATGGLLVTALR